MDHSGEGLEVQNTEVDSRCSPSSRALRGEQGWRPVSCSGSLVAFYLWLEILGETEFKVITD